jgi:cytoskeleton protein RodZ
MESVALSRESVSRQPDETILAAFRDVGQILAEARREHNLTIKQVAAEIHIRQQYLIDIEEGQLSDLPGPVYIFGFIRTYARLLDLDEKELIRRIRTLPDLPTYGRSQIQVPLRAEEEPNFPVLIVSGILIFLMAIGGYFFLKPSAQVPLPVVNEMAIADPATQPKEGPSSPFTEEGALEAPPSALPDGASSQISSPDKTSLESPDSSVAKGETPKPVLQKKMMVKAKEPSWIEVRDESGRVLFMKVLKSGEEYVAPEKPGVTINTGNAGGIDIFIGDMKLPPLGARGDVRRGIRLETFR